MFEGETGVYVVCTLHVLCDSILFEFQNVSVSIMNLGEGFYWIANQIELKERQKMIREQE